MSYVPPDANLSEVVSEGARERMKGDLHPAAVRLSAALPVHTHTRPVPAFKERNSANNTRAVICNGIHYESLTEASRQIGVCREAIRKRIYKGTARYA